MNNREQFNLPGVCIWIAGSLLGRTWKPRFSGSQQFNPFHNPVNGTIFCFWHSRLLQFSYVFRHCGMTAIVSGSRDGEIAAYAANRWGHRTIRGSSTRYGVTAMRQSIEALREGHNIIVIPDGPRGPREEVKPGIAEIALTARAPVVPLAASAARAWVLNSWDRFVIPKPFSAITFTFKEALQPDAFPSKREKGSELLRAEIQKALCA